MSRPAFAGLLSLVAFLALSSASLTQQPTLKVENLSPLPTHPGAWVNSAPISSKMMEGKAALLYFYEEQCPSCKGKWPEIMETAKKFDGRPIVFIAVNSGNPRPAVEQYAREVGLKWPVIVDTDRKLEQAAGVPPLSLQNIMQVALIMPDGKIGRGNWSDIAGSAETALKDAKWKIDPMGLAPQLKPAWLAMEMGDFAGAGQFLKKARANAKPEIKESIARLDAVVSKEVAELAAQGKAASDAGNKLEAFKAYSRLLEQYAGFEMPAGVEEARKALAMDPVVKAAMTAGAQLANAKKQLATGSPLAKKRVTVILEKIIKDSPDSEAGQEAKTLLDQLKQG